MPRVACSPVTASAAPSAEAVLVNTVEAAAARDREVVAAAVVTAAAFVRVASVLLLTLEEEGSVLADRAFDSTPLPPPLASGDVVTPLLRRREKWSGIGQWAGAEEEWECFSSLTLSMLNAVAPFVKMTTGRREGGMQPEVEPEVDDPACEAAVSDLCSARKVRRLWRSWCQRLCFRHVR
jgi:hypothetical protein